LDFENSTWYRIFYRIIDIIEKLVYFIIGIAIPIQVGWSSRSKPYSSYFTTSDIEHIAKSIGFSVEKVTFYLDNLFIALAALIIILTFKLSAWQKLKYTNFKILKKISICIALLWITYKIINNV